MVGKQGFANDPEEEGGGQFEVPWRMTPEASGGGLVQDVGSHAVDLLDALVGPLDVDRDTTQATRSPSSRVPVEDFVAFDFFASDPVNSAKIPGHCRWDFAQPAGRGKHELLRIVGTKRAVEVRVLSSDGLKITDYAESDSDVGGAPMVTWEPHPPSEHVHQNLIQSIVNELLDTPGATQQGPGLVALAVCPCPGNVGLRATKHLDHALLPFYGDRSAGFWDRNTNTESA